MVDEQSASHQVMESALGRTPILSQAQRDHVMRKFRRQSIRILVATDSEEIVRRVEAFGGEPILTSSA